MYHLTPAQLDRNFRDITLDPSLADYRDSRDPVFSLSGFAWFDQEHLYCRLPQASLPCFPEELQQLAWNTSGGMLRFRSDTDVVTIRAKLLYREDYPHMPRTCSAGFDVYCGKAFSRKFYGVVKPEYGALTYENAVYLPNDDHQMRDWLIHFPLFNGVEKLEIGVRSGRNMEPASPFTHELPIVFYGSSITHGACASRPGNSYVNILSRRFDAPVVNLGFSGNAKGEPEMARLIAGLPMSCFVLDYDYNAPTVEHLQNTHYAFYDIIRRAQPDLPILMLSRPNVCAEIPEYIERRRIVSSTYQQALQSGDQNIYFLDGESFFLGTERWDCTVDGVHPTDLGFWRMADRIASVLDPILNG